MDVREKLVELLSYFADGYSIENRHIVDGTKVCDWFSWDEPNEYEKGIVVGLRIAQTIAEIVERNCEEGE